MLTFELPSDEYRRRLRHALLKDLGDMKALRKKNIEEEADVSDIDYKITLIDGGKGGTPGLLQIFSTQGELFGDTKRSGDPAQMSIEDAVVEATYREEKGERKWVDWVPHPRPKAGERVRALDGDSLFVIVDALGWERIDGKNHSPHGDTPIDEALFSVYAVPIARADGFTQDDKVKIYLKTDSVRDEISEWTQVPSPRVDAGEIREAVRAGTDTEDFEVPPTDDQSTITDLGAFGQSDEFDRVAEANGRALDESGIGSPPPVAAKEGNNSGKPARSRKRAAAGNLAGAVSKEVARATGDRKINARKGSKK